MAQEQVAVVGKTCEDVVRGNQEVSARASGDRERVRQCLWFSVDRRGMVLGWRRVAWNGKWDAGPGMRGGAEIARMGWAGYAGPPCVKQEAEMGPCRMGEAGTGTGGIQIACEVRILCRASLVQDYLSRPSRVPPFLC